MHSSDAIRVEILGDVNRQDENAKVFDVLHTRVKEDIRLGHNTIYDATNINYKRRHEFLQTLNKFDCQKVCVFMATPFEMCMEETSISPIFLMVHRHFVLAWRRVLVTLVGSTTTMPNVCTSCIW